MLQAWIFLSVLWSTRLAYYGSGSLLGEITEQRDNHAASSCEWKDPPENAEQCMLCAVGECEVTPGIYSKNGTIRTSRCKPHYTLINGYERDVCNNGEWSSRGHECVQCGTSRRHFTRNFGNMFTIQDPSGNPGDFPWMAAIFMSRKGDPWRVVCGGTLISPDIVLSAAHCLDNNGVRIKPEEVKVELGQVSVNYSSNEPDSIIVSAKDILLHDKYVGQSHQFDVDIALIVLEKRVKLSDFIMPACLDWRGDMKPEHGEEGVLAGWGSTEEKVQSKVLKWSYQDYNNYERCKSLMSSKDYAFLSPDKFCADDVEGMMTIGDSGSGLTFERNGIHYLYGVASTQMLSNSKQLRFFTDLMNEVHFTWLNQQWKKLQEQPNRGVSCTDGDVCVVS